jgi:hypothetical protein
MNTTTDEIKILYGKLTTLGQILAQESTDAAASSTDAVQVQQHIETLLSLSQDLANACADAEATADQLTAKLIAQNPANSALLQQISQGTLNESFIRVVNIPPHPYYSPVHTPGR